MYCPYGSRCLFRHFDYATDFRWYYYCNILRSNFLLQEITQAQRLYKAFKSLRSILKNDTKAITNKLFSLANPDMSNNNDCAEIYYRLPVFISLTSNSKSECISSKCSSHLTVEMLDALTDDDYVHCKCYLKDYIFEKVLVLVNTCVLSQKHSYNSELPANLQYIAVNMCRALIRTFSYPLQKKDLKMYDNLEYN